MPTISPGKARHGRRAVTPVIAVVIIIATAIVISVTFASWMGGVVGQYAKVEKVEIWSTLCIWNASGSYWKIEIKMKNTGTSSATLIGAFINNVEVEYYDTDLAVAGHTSTNMTTSTTITSGATRIINVYIGLGYASLSPRTTVIIKLQGASGMDHLKMLQLV